MNSDVIAKAERDSYLGKIVKSADLALTDGMPLIWISRLHGRAIREKVSGSDLVPRLCELAAQKGFRIFLLGGETGVPEMAAANLCRAFPDVRIVGTDSPPVGFEREEKELARIREKISAVHPDILLCCLGCPKQERFVYENSALYDATVSICAGATMDFLAGRVKRCPGWMSAWGLEWFYRFLKEPRRLFKRYFVDDMQIFRMALAYWPRSRERGEVVAARPCRILMCGSHLSCVKGGMVTVAQNMLAYKGFQCLSIKYIPTHTEGGRLKKSLFFAKQAAGVAACLFCGCAGKRPTEGPIAGKQSAAGSMAAKQPAKRAGDAAWRIGRRPDILYLHVSERGSLVRKGLLTFVAGARGVPVILHHHGAEFNAYYEGLNKGRKAWVRKILKRADLNLVLSKAHMRDILEKEPEAKVDFLYNTTAVRSRNEYRASSRRIVTLGRLGERKGTWDFLTALAEIQDELPEDIEVWLCGDGDLEQVRKMVGEKGLKSRVKHVGWIGGKEKADCLKNAMMHVLPSYSEGLPMSILETMSWGIPNVSTRISSIPEVIGDQENGLLIQPGDVEGLKSSILRLVHHEELRLQMSGRAYDTIRERFSMDTGMERLEMLCRMCLKGHPTGR